MPLTPAMIARNAQPVERDARPVRISSRETSYSEETITPETAITVSGVIAIITLISQDIASLPLLLYARKGRNKFRAYDNPYYKLMHDQPNSEMTSMVFRELIVGHLMGWGNFFSQKVLDKKGDVAELWPLRPDRMIVKRVEGVKIYEYRTADGKPRIFFADELLHIPGFGFDGMVGYSRLALARNAVGLAISAEKFASKFYSNGVNVGLVYKHPGQLDDIAYGRLKADLLEKSGVAESSKPLILEENMSIERIGIPADDRQFLETRKFQLAEINRIMGPVPPHMIGDVTNSTSWGTGIDSQEQGYVNHSLRSYAVRIEQALNTQLLLQADRDQGYFYEHLFDGLLRGDIQTRFESYVKAINNGIMSPNEVRAKENMNPYSTGDTYWQPLNMASSRAPAADPQSTASALEPLWRDAVARVMKREQNDVLGAVRRFGKKKDSAGLNAWLDDFYRHDHAQFMAKQFKPVMDAEMRLNGRDLSKSLDARMFQFLIDRQQVVMQCSAEEIEAEFERTSGVDEFMEFIFNDDI